MKNLAFLLLLLLSFSACKKEDKCTPGRATMVFVNTKSLPSSIVDGNGQEIATVPANDRKKIEVPTGCQKFNQNTYCLNECETQTYTL